MRKARTDFIHQSLPRVSPTKRIVFRINTRHSIFYCSVMCKLLITFFFPPFYLLISLLSSIFLLYSSKMVAFTTNPSFYCGPCPVTQLVIIVEENSNRSYLEDTVWIPFMPRMIRFCIFQ